MAQPPPQGVAALQNDSVYVILSYAVPTTHEEFQWGVLVLRNTANNESDLWQPTKSGDFNVVHTHPSGIAASQTFLAACKIGTVTTASWPEIHRIMTSQPKGSIVGFDSRAWVAGAVLDLDKPGVLPLGTSVHAIQGRVITAGRAAKDRVAENTGLPIILN